MTNMVFRERILINSMFSVAPNIVLAPNMTQNAERKHRTQDANTANFRSSRKQSLRMLCFHRCLSVHRGNVRGRGQTW